MHKIYFCKRCCTYTLREKCLNCGQKTITPKPAKFSLEDRFGSYRRLLKNDMENKTNKKNQHK